MTLILDLLDISIIESPFLQAGNFKAQNAHFHSHMERPMNIYTIFILDRWKIFLVGMLTVSLTAPADLVAQSPAIVNLGSTANYAILAGSLVSNIPGSAITGDIGLSPAAGSNISGFGTEEVTGMVLPWMQPGLR